MAYSTSCLKFVVLAFSIIFAASGVAMMVFSVANLVHFYSFSDFVPSNVSSPVLLLGLAGLAACGVAVLGWWGAMARNTCRLLLFSILLVMVVVLEFGGAIWCLVSRANFEDEMAKTMETSFSLYSTDEAVVKKWDALQRELECCGTDGPQDYRRMKAVSWACCASDSEQHGSCEMMRQRGCLTSLSLDVRERLLWTALFAMAASILQVTGVFCTCCLKNSLDNEERRNQIQNRNRLTLEMKT